MKILPINNTQNRQQNFKAKFSKYDVNQFVQELEFKDIDDIPKLYTMLEYIKNLPGKLAKLNKIGYWCQVCIDGKSLTSDRRYFTAFHALEDATINRKNTLIKETPLPRLSEEEYEDMFYRNSKKTVKDIETLFKE